MRVIIKEDENKLTFGDVEMNQWFIDSKGFVCAKVTKKSAISIFDAQGFPFAGHDETFDQFVKIQKILHVERIEF